MTSLHRFPTTGYQEQFVHSARDGVSTANLTIGLRFEGAFDREALDRAVRRLAARHETLRTTLCPGDPPEQLLHADARLAAVDVPPPAAPDGDDPLVELMAAECGRPFELFAEPLTRVRVTRLAPDVHGVVVTIHHAMADGWSMRVVARDLARLYRATVRGVELSLPPVELAPGDLATWERGPHEHVEHWRRTLGDVDPAGSIGPPLPVGLRPVHLFRNRTLATADDVRRLEALAARRGVATSTLLMAAFAATLASWSPAETVVVADIRSNRDLPGLHATVGLVADLVPIRIELGGRPTLATLAQRVQAAAREARRHRMPFGAIHRALGHRGPWHARRLIDATFNYRPAVEGRLAVAVEVDALRVTEVQLPLERHVWSLERDLLMPVDFALELAGADGALEGLVASDPQWLDEAVQRSLEDELVAVLATAPERIDAPIARPCRPAA